MAVALALARTVTGAPIWTVWVIITVQLAVMFTGWLVGEYLLDDCRRRVVAEQRKMHDAAVELTATKLAQALRGEENVTNLR